MQDPRMLNQRKQKSRKTMSTHDQVNYMRGLQEASPTLPVQNLQKVTKKGMKNDTTLYYRPQQRSRLSIEQESTAANEYRALRRKYLELEEESCSLGNELRVAEHEITTLEDEKLKLLDELLVLEGLVDPLEAHS
ncbi:hypothetical protein vseg_020548 [Gypsophila vaccaria]